MLLQCCHTFWFDILFILVFPNIDLNMFISVDRVICLFFGTNTRDTVAYIINSIPHHYFTMNNSFRFGSLVKYLFVHVTFCTQPNIHAPFSMWFSASKVSSFLLAVIIPRYLNDKDLLNYFISNSNLQYTGFFAIVTDSFLLWYLHIAIFSYYMVFIYLYYSVSLIYFL